MNEPKVLRNYYPAIEILRGVAVCMVVAHHAFGLGRFQSTQYGWLFESFGSTGVILFFILSSFLLTETLLRPKGDIKEYYLRRFFRIAPAYYFMLIFLYTFFAAPANIWSNQGFVQTTTNLLFLQHLSPATVSNLNVNGALWTLTVEAILYLLLPIFVFLMSKALKLTLLGLVALGVLFKFYAREGSFNQFYFGSQDIAPNQISFIQQQFPNWLPVFAAGMLLAVITTRKNFTSFKRNFSVLFLIPLFVPTIFVSLKISRSSDPTSLWFMSYHLLIAVALSVVVFVTSKFREVAKDTFTSFALYLGKRSYSIYLWHFPILLSIYGAGPQSSNFTQPSTSIFLIGIPVVLVVSEISYRLVELPLINYGKKYIATRKSQG